MTTLIAISPLFKSATILCLVLSGSILQHVAWTPILSFFSDKQNFMNVYLVKWSWGWTLLCIVPTVVVMSVLYSGADLGGMLRHCSRLGVSHLLWFTVTSLFNCVNNFLGECSDKKFTSYAVCLGHGAEWDGFDISGHVFLLTYCILVITEEVGSVKSELWSKYGEILVNENRIASNSRTSLLMQVYTCTSTFIPVLRVIATLEMAVWFLMVIFTACNFHTFTEKIVAFGVAVMSWFLTYKLWYGSKWAPSKPEDGHLNPLQVL